MVNELRKCCAKEEEPNKAEGLLLSCLYQELLRKVLKVAQLQAQLEGSRKDSNLITLKVRGNCYGRLILSYLQVWTL